MPCYHPLEAKASPSGRPIFRKDLNYGRFAKLIKLPCGRCIGCKVDRSKQWAIRLMHEAQLHEEKIFVTLTYNTEGLNAPEREPSGSLHPSLQEQRQNDAPVDRRARASMRTHEDNLCKEDAQLFTKRLHEYVDRKTEGLRGIRYYLAGEYGEKNKRPHYHAAIYGEGFYDDRYPWRTNDQGHILYRSSRLEKIWGMGHVEFGDLTFASAQYIAGYITKKLNPGRTAESIADYAQKYERVDRHGNVYLLQPEFAHMSRRPGIGAGWFKKFMTDVYPHDYVVVNGMKLKPPRFYDQLLEAVEPLTAEILKKEREEKAREYADDNTPARLRAKEAVATAKLNLKKHTLE